MKLAKVSICRDTGDLAGSGCKDRVVSYFIPGVSDIKLSNISRQIPIDVETGLRACRHAPPSTVMKSYNFWPSDVLRAYAEAGISISRPPAFKEDCSEVETYSQGRAPEIVMPVAGSRFLLRSANLENEKIVLKASLDADAEYAYWFVNNRLAGQTKAGETLEVSPPLGNAEVKAVDNMGRASSVWVEIKLVD